MKLKALLLTAVTLCLLLLIAASAGGQAGAPALRLRAGTFVPGVQGRMARLALPDDLRMASVPAGTTATYIVQFSGPVQEAWQEEMRLAGAEILEYLPDFAFKVRMTPQQAAQISRQPHVIWSGPFQPAFKIDPTLLHGSPDLVSVRGEPFASAEQLVQDVAGTGVLIVLRDGLNIVVQASETEIKTLAQLEGVAWIEPFAIHELQNKYAAGAILDTITAAGRGFDGSTQIAAIADGGLGGGDKKSAHKDLPETRITAIQNFSAPDVEGCMNVIPDGARDANKGHGTHTALSLAGSGGENGIGQGAAPAANLIFQAVEEYVEFDSGCSLSFTDGYYLMGVPIDLADLFQPAYQVGARVHANSWGRSARGVYTRDSMNTDKFTWQHRDLLVTFAAGNYGVDENSDGVVDEDSLGSPGTSKNALTVGASENDRDGNYACDLSLSYEPEDYTCRNLGGQNVVGTYGQSWPFDFFANPLKDDPVAGNAHQLAAFSARGPTNDGRLKPDVVAPGTWVLSGYSHLFQQGYGDERNPRTDRYQYDGWGFPLNIQYKYIGGTSMASPLAAGAAVLVRDYYQKAYGFSASAALVKGTLINSAVDLLDENNDGVNDNKVPIPNPHEGWGRIDAAGATDYGHLFVEDTTGLKTAETAVRRYDIKAGQPLKASLVWTDFPSSETAAVNLVNDLDLTVIGPGGWPVYKGNVFSGGWSLAGGTADRLNNVENVYVRAPEAGKWTVRVRGANVPKGPQPFALVVDFTAAPPPLGPHAAYLPSIYK